MDMSELEAILKKFEAQLAEPVQLEPLVISAPPAGETETVSAMEVPACFTQAFIDLMQSLAPEQVGEPESVKSLVTDLFGKLPVCVAG